MTWMCTACLLYSRMASADWDATWHSSCPGSLGGAWAELLSNGQARGHVLQVRPTSHGRFIVMCRRCYAYMQKRQGLLRRECLGSSRAKAVRDRAAARVAAGKHPDHNPPWTEVKLEGALFMFLRVAYIARAARVCPRICRVS